MAGASAERLRDELVRLMHRGADVRDFALGAARVLAADAYGLTERERDVTHLVARGLPTDAIASRLHLSSWTVQDHLKAIFEKVGVATRGELVARVFFQHRAPHL